MYKNSVRYWCTGATNTLSVGLRFNSNGDFGFVTVSSVVYWAPHESQSTYFPSATYFILKNNGDLQLYNSTLDWSCSGGKFSTSGACVTNSSLVTPNDECNNHPKVKPTAIPTMLLLTNQQVNPPLNQHPSLPIRQVNRQILQL